MLRVLITGGSGLIGQALRIRLEKEGYEVAFLSRKTKKYNSFTWDIERGTIDREALIQSDYIIHLTGANIGARRWTNKRKKEIRSSRIDSTNLLYAHIEKQNKKPKAFISASAIGYYGAVTSKQIFTETDPPSSDFLGHICRGWEDAADQFTKSGIRTVKIRTGIVLSKKGGALTKLLVPLRWGLGSAIGHGKQYMPWIHVEDVVDIYMFALENEKMHGAYNAVAPEHITNKAFNKKLAHMLHKPFWFPAIPAFVMKVLFGEMAAMLLKGSRVSSEKIREAGFNFQFPDLESAFHDLISK